MKEVRAEPCFAALRATLDSLAAECGPIDHSRTRITRRCEASGIELDRHALDPQRGRQRARQQPHRTPHESAGSALRLCYPIAR